MMDYVDRQEFEEFKRESEVHGDGSTIRIEKTAAGQYVTCTLPVDPGDSDDPIFVSSYDSTLDTYTIKWRAFYMWCNYFGDISNTSNMRYWTRKEVAAGSFTFDAEVYSTSSKLYLQARLEVTSGAFLHGCAVTLQWGGTLTGSDADTQNAQISNATSESGRVGTMVMICSGGSDTVKAPLKFDWSVTTMPMAWFDYAYDRQSTTISMPTFYPNTTTQPSFWSLNIGNSFDGNIFLGWTQSSNALAIASSTTGYDDYVQIGYAKTNSSGYLQAGIKYDDHLNRTFGHTGNWNDGTQVVYSDRGLIWKVV